MLLVGWADREEKERRTRSSGVGERTHGREQEERLFGEFQGKGVAWLWSTRTLKRMTRS